MNAHNRYSSWKRIREKGMPHYVIKQMTLITAGSLIGKEIGDYLGSRIWLKPFKTPDYMGLLCIWFFSVIIGLYSWRHKESQYRKLVLERNGDHGA